MEKSRYRANKMMDNTYKENRVWLLFIRLFEFLYNIFNKRNNVDNNALIDEIKEEASKIKPLKETDSKANNEWIKHANMTRNLILDNNPTFFLRWRTIRNTMNVTNSKFVLEELNYLKKTEEWDFFWKNFIKEDNICGRIPFILYPRSSGNSIHHSYVMKNFLEKTGKDFSSFRFIFEFGGGYGNICRLIHKAGFRGKYIIYDIPVFSTLQKFYLKSYRLAVYDKKSIINQKTGITCISNLSDLTNLLVGMAPQDKENSLFVATWSLSESPLNIREEVHKFLHYFGYFLVGYQDKFGEVDNKKYFAGFKAKNNKISWHDWPLKQLVAHNLLIGKIKRNGSKNT